jgi:HNH endonuclease/AP2 domain
MFCSIEGCEGKLYRKTGVCQKHYSSLNCRIVDCENQYYCSGLCEKHYKRARRNEYAGTKENDVVAEYAKTVLFYNKETGIFRWKAHKIVKSGTIAGCKNKRGYIQIYLFDRPYSAHRLAWLLVTGNWPVNEIDHKDAVRTNNVFNNLREATTAQNGYNRSVGSNNKIGLKGVRLGRRDKRYSARISADGKTYHLGIYKTAEDAHVAYVEAAKILHGEFWRSE